MHVSSGRLWGEVSDAEAGGEASDDHCVVALKVDVSREDVVLVADVAAEYTQVDDVGVDGWIVVAGSGRGEVDERVGPVGGLEVLDPQDGLPVLQLVGGRSGFCGQVSWLISNR